MEFPALAGMMLPPVENEMRQIVAEVLKPAFPAEPPDIHFSPDCFEAIHDMLVHHMGWENSGSEAGGKRIRPLMLLLTCAAAEGDWESALPAAAAVELLHNFSLIHDDIEDNSPQRRGRPAVWSLWGIPQAINTGDVLFTLSHLAMLRLDSRHEPAIVLQAARLLHQTCLALTQGQHLDMAYEEQRSLPMDAYWPVIQGKTASLLACTTELGALLAGSSPATRHAYRRFGLNLGLAFQVQDDLLGIWGDASLTGKSNASDLLSGKKSLPVLYGLQQAGEFAERWLAGPLNADEIPGIAATLRATGAYDYAQSVANSLTKDAIAALDQASPKGDAGTALRSLVSYLLNRQL
jgi:geranylgeranyl diphosphate synthase, type I